MKIGFQDFAKRGFGRTGRRAVIVGEIEMGDAQIERRVAQFALEVVRRVVAEIVPQAERKRRQLEAGPAGAPVAHLAVAVGCRCPHDDLPFYF